MTSYIKPVDSATLAERSATGRLDPAADLLLPAERAYIASRRGAHKLDSGRNELTALCLSGGGIRSAAFALGIMQKLAGENYLRLFDYLSTVSGGGYIGSSLTWLTSTEFHKRSHVQFGVGPSGGPSGGAAPFPYGTDSPIAATPRHPPRDEDHFLTYLRSHGQYLIPGGGITLVSGIAVLLRGILLNLLVWLPIAAFLAFLLGARQDAGFARILTIGLILWGFFALCSMIYSLFTIMRRSPEARRYRLRRLFETWASWVLIFAVALTVIGTLPFVAHAVHRWIGAQGGFGFLVTGAASGVWSFFKSRSSEKSALPLGTLAPIAALLFCYGFLVLAYDLGTDPATLLGGSVHVPGNPPLLYTVALVIALVLGLVVNLNYLTIHRYYRDRLMEAFMPDVALARTNEAGPARAADPAALAAMCRDDDPRGPYHLINTNLILTGTTDKTRRTRGGDSFILSPRYCGSNATGWRATESFFDNQVTLATAMAISGAAANPNAGSGGVGITRNPIVSLVMSLLNVRLGMWVPNPGRKHQWIRPNHFEPGLLDLVDWKRDETSWTLRLSDGGHFDNLGIYEMVRRRAELIVVSDASADPDYSFSDLTEAMVRVKQDFGARILFDDVPPLDALMPLADPLPFPLKTHRSKRGYARATITYCDGTTGTLLYLTTTIVEGLRLELLGYLSANPAFPDETTADQFFSAAQFEAYRELGYVVASQMLDGVPPAPGAGGPADPADAGYRAEFESRLRRLGA